jgi:hypothetical protein
MTYRTTPLAEPGVASSAGRLQQAVEAIHLYPFVAVVERAGGPVGDFEFPKRGTEWQSH